jgi:hypothetical protein
MYHDVFLIHVPKKFNFNMILLIRTSDIKLFKGLKYLISSCGNTLLCLHIVIKFWRLFLEFVIEEEI